jgi:hypothetical protein
LLPFIHTAETFYGAGADLACPPCERALHADQPPLHYELIKRELRRRGKLDDTEIVAYVNDGRWVACCPFCPSAQVVTPADPRFLCVGAAGCFNLPAGGAYIRVVFPSQRERKRIESALLRRPHMANRNWLPHETADDLVAENILQAVERI